MSSLLFFSKFGNCLEFEQGLIGGAAYDATGTPFPEATVELVKKADAILLGAVGGYQWESLDIALRPEKGSYQLHGSIINIHMTQCHIRVLLMHFRHHFTP
jgi:3-isopropylmalate dehydrogenase